jgi:hypothetical protein
VVLGGETGRAGGAILSGAVLTACDAVRRDLFGGL